MKTLLAIATVALAVLTAPSACAADPTTFEEFKSLSETQQAKLLSNHAGEAYLNYLRWRWRIELGEEGWRQKQLERLADTPGRVALSSFFTSYKHLRQAYLAQDRRRPGMSEAELATIRAEFGKDWQETGHQLTEATQLVSTLALTPEEKALSDRAEKIDVTWDERWPQGTGKKWVVTAADMQAIDQARREILEAMAKLPRMTPAELQQAIDALPEHEWVPPGAVHLH